MNELTPETAAEHGVDEGWRFGLRRRAEWRDADPFGHVNHLTYLAWCEDVRNRYLEAIGLPRLSADTPGPVLRDVSFAYHRPLAYGDEVLVTARTASVRRTSFRMEYAVWCRGLAGRGAALCVLVVNRTGERVAVSDDMRAAMRRIDPDLVEEVA